MILITHLLLYLLNLTNSSCSESRQTDAPGDYVLCRWCGSDLSPASYIINFRSPTAINSRNQTIFGLQQVFVQSLENPLHIRFETITVSTAHCIGKGDWQSDYSWFPGYSWKPCVCARCGRHLGWMFEPLSSANIERIYPSSDGFYALILDNLISEFYSDSLLIKPKVTFR
ncbi:unnamed protein product [Bemisia tabaci]|uniref:CULT domain-containing protein n=1 Tax=Bemisia tabaci TaxID=7038 RepID=A0A9P0AJI4_BEMTA|nr:PREDICTED: protein cereblon homolog isoform X2 [Bemisia tabaci]CAH0393172.1 unnamed protein product [Bemisia tabaci]